MEESLILTQAVAVAWRDAPLADVAAIESELIDVLRELDAAPPADASPVWERLLEVVGHAPEFGNRVQQAARSMRLAEERGHDSALVPLFRRNEVAVVYATDRAVTGETDALRRYGGARGDRVQYGTARVELPDDHRMGRLPKPRHWPLRFGRRTDLQFVLEEADGLTDPLVAQLRWAPGPDILLFVHGYNVRFADAVRRTAQLAFDVNFTGVPVAYSWPSEGGTLSYQIDGENAAASQRNFRRTLTELSRNGKVHVVAHSMGNRILTETLSTLSGYELGHVVFAAPDVDAKVFTDRAGEFAGDAERYTLYVSNRDRALAIAQRLAGYPRAGNAGPDIVVVDGIDTIDASDLDTGLLSHSYAMEHRSIIADLYSLLRHNQPPGERFGMRPAISPQGPYWEFKR